MAELKIKFRPHKPEDTSSLFRLVQEAAKADQVDADSTLERQPSKKELDDPGILVAEESATGEVVAYGAIRSWQEDDGTHVYLLSGKVRPDARSRGVGTALLKELESRALPQAAPDGKRVYGTNASETDSGAEELMKAAGYKKVWSQVEMIFDVPDNIQQREALDGLEIRPVSGDDDRRLVYKANKEVYSGQFGSSMESESDYQEFLEGSPDPALWSVMWNGTDVAGFVLSRPRPYGAEMMEVSVLPGFRRRGLATYLMIENMLMLRKRGVRTVRLHTGAEGKNGGRQLYESLGFKALKEHYRYRKKF